MLITRFGSIASQIIAGLDQYTKALLHFNGADAATTFTDESGKTWTANGNAQLDTADKVFGTASGLFDGSGDWIDTPDSEDFNVGSGAWSVEFRAKRAATGVLHRILGQCDSSATTSSTFISGLISSGNTVSFYVYSGTTSYQVTSTGTIDANWHDYALCSDGTTLRLFIDGTVDGTVNVSGVTLNNSSYKFSIGRLGEYNGGNFNGWIDEFRFSKGVARHTANFTPPTAEFAA